jgi:hypothetical protein
VREAAAIPIALHTDDADPVESIHRRPSPTTVSSATDAHPNVRTPEDG